MSENSQNPQGGWQQNQWSQPQGANNVNPQQPVGQPQQPWGANPNPATSPMGFIEAVKVCFSKYADFNGRADRAEFWWWYLFHSS